jgi:Oxidoreductase molybdopterin binding domain
MPIARLHHAGCLFVLTASLFGASLHAEDGPALSDKTINIVVDGKTTTLDRAAFAGLPHITVSAAAHNDPPSRWQGVALQDVLGRAAIPTGEALRGRAMARFVRVTASDGYQVIFSVAELDPAFGDVHVVVADSKDGKPLDKDGPYRLIVPGDKRPARWERNVRSIELVDASTQPLK